MQGLFDAEINGVFALIARNDQSGVHRARDHGLGDWEVNKKKIPGGLKSLSDAASTLNLRFGIWMEPEMVNANSKCFKEHPDWIIQDQLHEKDIQLVLCGEGPREKQILRYAKKRLTNQPEVLFLNHQDLNTLLNTCDLYGHASAVDIESMSLLEAETCGAVPLINAAKTSAMSAFSLDPHCVFKANSASAMAEQIDYFFEHPEVRKPLSERYVRYAEQFEYDKVMVRQSISRVAR